MKATPDKKNIPFFDLKDSDEKYRLLVENLNDAIVISHEDRFIYFNTQFADLLGYDPEELMNKDYREVYSKKSLDILHKRESIRKRGESVPSRYETIFINKSGEEVQIEANVAIFNYHGRNATFAVIRDISEQKKSEKMIADSEKLYRTLFELSPTGALLEDISGLILDVNPAFCKSMGYNKKDLVGKKVEILVHPDSLGKVIKNIKLLKKGKILKHREKSLRKDGTFCYMDLHESKIILPDGKQGILCIADDVTKKVKSEDERILKERMEGVLELAGAVCHELNQPMTVVSVNSEIISPDMDKKEFTSKLDGIKREIRKMGKITRKLMHITRYETREYLNGRKILDIDKSISNDE